MIARAEVTEAFVGLGANLENPLVQIRQAISELGALGKTRLLGVSSLYRSTPVGYADQPDFINAVARLQTELSPRELLAALHAIENRHGRRRSVRNAPRTLDLDLLLYGLTVVCEEGLILPHPRMHERAFVLEPLAEIAPDASVPGYGPVAQLLERVGRGGVEKLDAT
jgi:2-amino-4-hydroxy-6-hydroxymethyldihydropteridine diphosphokinase